MARFTSFTDVIAKLYYDDIFLELAGYIEENPDRLECRSGAVLEPQEARLEYMRVEKLDIREGGASSIASVGKAVTTAATRGASASALKLDVIVSAEIEIAETVRREYNTDAVGQWFRVECSCDFDHHGIDNFRVHGFSVYSPARAGRPGQLSDHFVPIISRGQLDAVAEDFLCRHYPEALNTPTPVSTDELAGRMGLAIRQGRITKNGTAFGQIFFDNCLIMLYDPRQGVYYEESITAGTILVDPEIFFMYTLGSYRNTIVHECVHWDLHRRFFLLEKLYNPEAKSIVCQVREGAAPDKMSTPLEWMEWQANHLAPRILMPASTTRQKIMELFAEAGELEPAFAPSEVMERVISSLADFFGVSIQSAKIRMIDLGYTEAIGVYNYVEGRHVPGHSFNPEAISDNQTFVIDAADLAFAFVTQSEFKALAQSGRYLYVDRHVCVNHSRYIDRTAAGTACLTAYARQHMDECCLTFEVTYTANSRFGVGHYTECALFRSALSGTKKTTNYLPGGQLNRAIDVNDELKEECREAVRTIAAIMKGLPAGFGDTLTAHMERLRITNEALTDRCLISPENISRYRNDRKKASLPTVIALCVGLRLPPPLGSDMVAKAGFKLTGGEEDVAYRLILNMMTNNSIYECNETLVAIGMRPLVREE
ncbi:MAG: hypothetical protein Q4B48_02810 [Syntrophomonadaceae bacterium]|nr:hypothetical protein [Syntrophomonadaceae bacterium]